MSVIAAILQEGFCNRMSQYAFCRAYAEKHGCELQTDFWMGQDVFEINDPPRQMELPQVTMENFEEWNGQKDIQIAGWGQHQKCLIYTRRDARRYFTFRPKILDMLAGVPKLEVAAHLRWADFLAYPEAGFIAISKESYLRACDQFGIDKTKITWVSEENPIVVPGIDQGVWTSPNSDHHTRQTDTRRTSLGFLPDFYALMQADVLLRANSTFSLWAAILGHHKTVLSPNLCGIMKERHPQLVPFSRGNHNAMTHTWHGHSDLRLKE